jgi:hypothetical protein
VIAAAAPLLRLLVPRYCNTSQASKAFLHLASLLSPGVRSAGRLPPIKPVWRVLLNGLESVHFLARNERIDGQLGQ